jgi:hypothetical protein
VSLTNRDQNAPSIAAVLTEDVGTNTGVPASQFTSIQWPPKITSSPEELAALQAADPFAKKFEESKRRRAARG